MNMHQLNESIKHMESEQRKKYLINTLHALGVYETMDGRALEVVSLYTLEWTHVEIAKEMVRAYEGR